jgi:hypothetical protein
METETKKLSQKKAVELCLAAGVEEVQAGVAWIKANHGIDLKPTSFSSYKSQLRSGNGAKTTRKYTKKTDAATVTATVGTNGSAPHNRISDLMPASAVPDDRIVNDSCVEPMTPSDAVNIALGLSTAMKKHGADAVLEIVTKVNQSCGK